MQGHRSTNPHASEATPPSRFSDETISSWSGWFTGESSSIRNVGNQNPVHEERLGHGGYEPGNSSFPNPLNLELSDETISSWSGWFTGESSSIRNVGNQNPVHEERLGHGGYEPANSSSPLNLELSLGHGESSHSPSFRSGGIPQSLNLFEGHASPGSSSAVPLLPCKRKAPVEGAEHLSLGPSNDSVEHHRYQVGGSAVTPVTETMRQACPHVQSHSGLLTVDQSVNFRPTHLASSHGSSSVIHVPGVQRTTEPLLRDGPSSSGIGGLSVTSGERTPVLPQGEYSRTVRRARSDLPAHVPVIDLTASPVRPSNLISGSTNSVTHASAPPVTVHHDGSESEDEGADISPLVQSGPTVVPQVNALTQRAHRQGEPMTADSDSVYSSEDEDEYIDVSALLQPDSDLQEDVSGDSSSQALAAGSERRNRLLSEVRNVLAVLRNGGRLNLAELTVHPPWLGRLIAMHEAHQDMRVDVDNMSYEELLALGERIGNVSTGLSEETIERCLKKVKFYTPRYGSTKAESCCICQEAFVKGVKLGRLDCGHDFHTDCIKQWLMEKNLCPICRTTALANAASS